MDASPQRTLRDGRVEQDLVAAAQHGDRSAYVDLIRPRMDRLYVIAHRILRDVDRAEDALQDALVIAWRDLRGLRDPDRLDAWLYRVVVRECVAQAQRERHRTANLVLLTFEEASVPDTSLSLADRDQLERGFQHLSPTQRAVVVLHHYAGYGLTEIATVLGVPPGTVRSRLHHAHRAMRAALDADARTGVPEGRPA
jgi:RNA polymerase sigma-70 factor, ECF subfamily